MPLSIEKMRTLQQAAFVQFTREFSEIHTDSSEDAFDVEVRYNIAKIRATTDENITQWAQAASSDPEEQTYFAQKVTQLIMLEELKNPVVTRQRSGASSASIASRLGGTDPQKLAQNAREVYFAEHPLPENYMDRIVTLEKLITGLAEGTVIFTQNPTNPQAVESARAILIEELMEKHHRLINNDQLHALHLLHEAGIIMQAGITRHGATLASGSLADRLPILVLQAIPTSIVNLQQKINLDALPQALRAEVQDVLNHLQSFSSELLALHNLVQQGIIQMPIESQLDFIAKLKGENSFERQVSFNQAIQAFITPVNVNPFYIEPPQVSQIGGHEHTLIQRSVEASQKSFYEQFESFIAEYVSNLDKANDKDIKYVKSLGLTLQSVAGQIYTRFINNMQKPFYQANPAMAVRDAIMDYDTTVSIDAIPNNDPMFNAFKAAFATAASINVTIILNHAYAERSIDATQYEQLHQEYTRLYLEDDSDEETNELEGQLLSQACQNLEITMDFSDLHSSMQGTSLAGNSDVEAIMQEAINAQSSGHTL